MHFTEKKLAEVGGGVVEWGHETGDLPAVCAAFFQFL